ncbi:Lysosome-associated membrane glycoprotein 1 [Anthophora quadrimaculata]
MMSKFLLLLCFTAVHVLGDGPENALSSNNTDNLSTSVPSPQNVPEQHFTTNSSSKIISGGVVPISADSSKNKTKPEEIVVSQSSVPSHTTAPIPATTIPPDTTTILINVTKSSIEQIPHATNEPAVMQAPVSTAVATALAPGKWIVNETNKVCIIVQMSAMFNVSYVNTNRTRFFKTFLLPGDNATTNVSGNCGEVQQTLTLTWSSKNITNASMTIHFVKNESAKHYSLHHLEVVLPVTDFPNTTLGKYFIYNKSAIMNVIYNKSSEHPLVLMNETNSNFMVGLSYAYKCLQQQKLMLKQNDTQEASGYLILSDLQFVAFKADNYTVFGLAQDCAFTTPDIVPIAVGCILSILVVFVLIAYTIGRRRNQTNNYRSM